MKGRMDWGKVLKHTVVGGVLALVSTAGAMRADILVTSISDDETACGVSSVTCLREAIAAAVANPGADTIKVLEEGTINLLRGALSIVGGGDLTIEGAGANLTTISAAGQGHSVFEVVHQGTVTFRGLTVTGGSTGASGGGIAVLSNGTPPLIIVVDRCSITGNTAVGSGGGIAMFSGTELRVENSTISMNSAFEQAGGIYVVGNSNSTKITQSTISGNTADADGDGFGAGGGVSSGTLTIEASTITANTNGGIVAQSASSIKNSIVAKQASGNDCAGGAVYSANAYNIFSGGCGAGATDSIADPLLGLLANNGGPTATHALFSGSPAIDKVTSGCAQTEDQRGVKRPQGGACDTGSFEFQQDAVGTIQSLLSWMDSQVTSGALVGAGTGKSAASRLNALKNMLLAADNKLGNGNQESACGQLRETLRRTDGQPEPGDFVMDGNVAGTAAELAAKIAALMTAQGCTL